MRQLFIWSVVCQFLVSFCFGDGVPGLINYQGRLTDQTGTPLAAGSYVLQFRLWDSPTAANGIDLIWAQQQNVTVQTNGVFNVILGSPGGSFIPGANPSVTNLALAFGLSNEFLGVTVTTSNGVAISTVSEIQPRQQFLSSPYTFIAGNGVPSGGVIMWSGSVTNIPAGWALCDGSKGTPNLTDKFIIAAGGQYPVGTNNPAPFHTHGTGTYLVPPHTHGMNYQGGTVGWNASRGSSSTDQDAVPRGQLNTYDTAASAALPLSGVSGGSVSVPPFYALAFIMKL